MIITITALSKRAKDYLNTPETMALRVKNALNNQIFKRQTGLDLKKCLKETTQDGVLTVEVIDERVMKYIYLDRLLYSIEERMNEHGLHRPEDYTVSITGNKVN